MLIASNAHTHTTFCDGKNTVEEMAKAAERLGFVSLGFSGHAPQPVEHLCDMTDPAGYLGELDRVAKAFEGRLRIWKGIEYDLYAECDLSGYDYVLGSAHYLKFGEEEYGVDGDPARLEYAYRELLHGDGEELVRMYYRAVSACAKKLKPDIMGHFDVVRKHNGDEAGRYFDVEAPFYKKAALAALEDVLECGAILEVNTGGMARGFLKTPYPQKFLLDAWHEMGGEVIICSDSHRADTLDYGFDQALELVRSAGFRSICRLGAGKRLFDEVEI